MVQINSEGKAARRMVRRERERESVSPSFSSRHFFFFFFAAFRLFGTTKPHQNSTKTASYVGYIWEADI